MARTMFRENYRSSIRKGTLIRPMPESTPMTSTSKEERHLAEKTSLAQKRVLALTFWAPRMVLEPREPLELLELELLAPMALRELLALTVLRPVLELLE